MLNNGVLQERVRVGGNKVADKSLEVFLLLVIEVRRGIRWLLIHRARYSKTQHGQAVPRASLLFRSPF